MRQIGIMGGTFNPIHLGHLVAAECAREAANLDEVWFMPAHVPPHKTNHPQADGKHRLEMTRLAIAGNPSFRASDWELARGGVSYTYETVISLRAAYPAVSWHWIIGGDMVDYLPKWHRIDELMRLIRFVGLHRPGIRWNEEKLPAAWRGRILAADMPQMDISSTDIRERRAAGRSIRYLVPEAVEHYMARWGLYESDAPAID
ncbi:nicotinate-nucleotide adenylyltransferase [Paenibacillus dendritiformis]|uniref:nicotinate-nucleotide adenylyltransferase n=1 Tax=Paenibacillus dendritiformis TaxID=130049 RepID=UPI000DA767B9|nr:nicotinate-nucleotide adenylyltransferase [Paenibacillus dendritiformis]PZM67181.1 nicotinate-nucleotide adenylyltransferase [Paenibacillus dendritiformis]